MSRLAFSGTRYPSLPFAHLLRGVPASTPSLASSWAWRRVPVVPSIHSPFSPAGCAARDRQGCFPYFGSQAELGRRHLVTLPDKNLASAFDELEGELKKRGIETKHPELEALLQEEQKEEESDERWRVLFFGMPHERRVVLIWVLLLFALTSTYRAHRYKAETEHLEEQQNEVEKRLAEVHEAWKDALLTNSSVLVTIKNEEQLHRAIELIYDGLAGVPTTTNASPSSSGSPPVSSSPPQAQPAPKSFTL